jgi:hypothetical protein
VRQSVVESANLFYCGVFYTLYTVWKRGKYTMKESGFVLKDVQKLAKDSPRAMVAKASEKL